MMDVDSADHAAACGVVALAAGATFVVAAFDQGGAAVYRVETNKMGDDRSPRLVPVLQNNCSKQWLVSDHVSAINLHESLAYFTLRTGAVVGVSLHQGCVLWQTPTLFAGSTHSMRVGSRLYAGANDGVVSVNVRMLQLVGVCASHMEDKPPSMLDYVLAEYLPPAIFLIGVVVLLVEVLQMMRFATSPATPQVWHRVCLVVPNVLVVCGSYLHRCSE